MDSISGVRVKQPDTRPVSAADRSAGLITVDIETMHGEPCFADTRIPVKILFDHLQAGDPIEEFLDNFPDVSRESAVAVIILAGDYLIDSLRK